MTGVSTIWGILLILAFAPLVVYANGPSRALVIANLEKPRPVRKWCILDVFKVKSTTSTYIAFPIYPFLSPHDVLLIRR